MINDILSYAKRILLLIISWLVFPQLYRNGKKSSYNVV